jgi:hypothetical protein
MLIQPAEDALLTEATKMPGRAGHDVTREAPLPSGASEPQSPIDHIRPCDRGSSVLDRIAEAQECRRTWLQKA